MGLHVKLQTWVLGCAVAQGASGLVNANVSTCLLPGTPHSSKSSVLFNDLHQTTLQGTLISLIPLRIDWRPCLSSPAASQPSAAQSPPSPLPSGPLELPWLSRWRLRSIAFTLQRAKLNALISPALLLLSAPLIQQAAPCRQSRSKAKCSSKLFTKFRTVL